MDMDEKIINYLKWRVVDLGKNPDEWEMWYDVYKSKENEKFNSDLRRKANKYCNPPRRSFLWLTLSPDKFLRNMDNTPENLQALGSWCENWFSHNPKYYGSYSWVVENGSEGNHLHVHALLEMKSSHKHAEKLKQSWARHFPNHQLLTSVDATTEAYHNGTKKGEYCYANFMEDAIDKDGKVILQDKLLYMENEKKGCHENLSDTGFRGSRGFLSDNS